MKIYVKDADRNQLESEGVELPDGARSLHIVPRVAVAEIYYAIEPSLSLADLYPERRPESAPKPSYPLTFLGRGPAPRRANKPRRTK